VQVRVCGVGVAVRRLGGGTGRMAAHAEVRVPVGWRCAAQFRCGGAAQVGVAAQVVEQLGVVVWQTLVGAMAADSYSGIERRNQLLHELPIANSQEHALF